MNGPEPSTIVNELLYKPADMRRMLRDVLSVALERGTAGEFSALDLPTHGKQAHGGSGIAGSAFRILADAGILAPVGVWSEGEFLQRRKRNAGGNPIGVWRIIMERRSLAETLLARCAGSLGERAEQAEMMLV